MMALPEMKEISETWKDKVTVISLSTDTEKGWKEISKTKDMSWVNLNDFGGMSGLAAKYLSLIHILIKPDVAVSTPEAYSLVTPKVPAISLKEIINKPVSEWKRCV